MVHQGSNLHDTRNLSSLKYSCSSQGTNFTCSDAQQLFADLALEVPLWPYESWRGSTSECILREVSCHSEVMADWWCSLSRLQLTEDAERLPDHPAGQGYGPRLWGGGAGNGLRAAQSVSLEDSSGLSWRVGVFQVFFWVEGIWYKAWRSTYAVGSSLKGVEFFLVYVHCVVGLFGVVLACSTLLW